MNTKRKESIWLFILVTLMIFFLAFSQSAPGRRVLDGSDILFVPPARWLQEKRNAVRNFFTQTRDIRRLQEENRSLRKQLNDLLVEEVKFTEIEAENKRLRLLLNFSRQNPLYSFQGATIVGRVVGVQPDNVSQIVTIDCGANQGIRRGMPVVAAEGLVGRILQVHAETSEVLLLIDPASVVNAQVQSSRAPGLVRGRVLKLPLITFVPQGALIRPGDIVLTSGVGNTFPRGILIGQVISVSYKDYEMFQQAVIRPTVDFQRLEEVLVITNFHPLNKHGGE